MGSAAKLDMASTIRPLPRRWQTLGHGLQRVLDAGAGLAVDQDDVGDAGVGCSCARPRRRETGDSSATGIERGLAGPSSG
jgi:hypothetical protein